MSVEQLTDLPLEIDGRVIRTIQVPFSQQELDRLRELRKLKEKWQNEAMRGSGWTRELYVNLDIPWGYSLIKRERAYGDIRKGLDLIYKALEKEEQSKEVSSLADDLRQIESGLKSFLPPDEPEKK